MASRLPRLVTLAVTAVLAAFTAWQPARAQPIVLDKVLVVVNDDVITDGEYRAQLELARRQMPQGRRPSDDVLRRQILDRLITERVQIQYAERTGISVDEAAVNEAIQQIARTNRLSLEQMKAELAKDGVTLVDFRTQIRNQLIIRRLIERNINRRVSVGEGEIEHWLATQEPAAPPKPVTEYHISHILVAIPPQRDETAVRAAQARVAAVHQQLREGLSFAKAAREFSQGAEAPQGGQIGWRRLQDLPPAVAKLISSLKPGQLSPILRSNLGYHIFRLDRTRQQKVDRPVRTETRARHILLRTTELFTDEDARTQLQRFIERIKAGEDFGDLARAHSDDTATAARGGELDWVAAGTLDPAFAEAMNALPVGTVSQPVQSRFGWHIIEVLDRRTLDAADANAREEAHRQLRRKKAEERYDRFLRQLRDEAYIRYVAEEFAQ